LSRPDCAIISFEMNNALAEAPPVLQLNEVTLPPASLTLPDLADPAWKGFPIAGSEESRLHYTGWIRVQQFVPGEALLKGINRLELEQSPSGHSSQIRRIEIQLRYPSKASF
jgi:hypothetical protein